MTDDWLQGLVERLLETNKKFALFKATRNAENKKKPKVKEIPKFNMSQYSDRTHLTQKLTGRLPHYSSRVPCGSSAHGLRSVERGSFIMK
jgi:flagella basal body P-ring formation protein FlgA